MKPFGRLRQSGVLNYIVIILCVLVLTVMLAGDRLPSQQASPKVSHLGRYNTDFTSQQQTLQLLNELLKRLNNSGPLISINITNVIQPGVHQYGQTMVVDQGQSKVAPLQNTDAKFADLSQDLDDDNNKQETPQPEPVNKMIDNFKPVLSKKQKASLYSALMKLVEVSDKKNFTYMMYSGTLLGSYRHHGIVPWDDDFDMLMEYSKRTDIVEALSACSPEFDIWVAGARVKFYAPGGVQTSKYPWKWPYIDLSFYKENATHIWDGSMEDDYGDRAYLYPKHTIFPLHKRPLDQYFLNSPRDAYDALLRTYSQTALTGCSTAYYSHKNESLTQHTYKLPCWALSKHYPFVHRKALMGSMQETLMLNKKVVHTLLVDEPEYAVTKPFEVVLA